MSPEGIDPTTGKPLPTREEVARALETLMRYHNHPATATEAKEETE